MRVRSTAEIRGTPEMFRRPFIQIMVKERLWEMQQLLFSPGRVGSSSLIIRLTHLDEVNWLGTLSSSSTSSTSSLMFKGVTGLGLPDVSRVKLASLQTVAVVYLMSELLLPR